MWVQGSCSLSGGRISGVGCNEMVVDRLCQRGVLDDHAAGGHAQVVKVLDLLVLNASLSVLRYEDRDHCEPLHDATDCEQHEIEWVVVARDCGPEAGHPDREGDDAEVEHPHGANGLGDEARDPIV